MKKDHTELLNLARHRWRECSEHTQEMENRREGGEDAKFASGKQWSDTDEVARKAVGLPCFVFNRMGGFLHQVENDYRQNPIGITLSPFDSDEDKEIARIDQGLVKHIQYNSASKWAQQEAFIEACRTGLGALKLSARYCDDGSFNNQELVIERIPDAINRLWFDPHAKDPDHSDIRYAFEVDYIERREFELQYPDSESVSSQFWGDAGYSFEGGWIKNLIRVANYYYITKEKKQWYLWPDGSGQFEPPPVVTEVREREVPVVRCALINGHEVLEEYEWPGTSIPIFIITGEEAWVDGYRMRKGVIRDAKAAQQLYNYYRSSEAATVGLAPKVPYVAAAGQVEGFEYMWETANQVPRGVLLYKPIDVNGNVLPAPRRESFEPAIAALSAGAAQAADDMKASTLIFDASLGARSNETSGVAINARKAEGNQGNLHFRDNLARAITRLGKMIVEVRRHYYDTARTIRILGKDDQESVVKINQPFEDETGNVTVIDMRAEAKYDVTVKAGPSFDTQRQEAFADFTEWVRAYPPLMQIAGDIIFRNSDSPGADEIAERMKKALPAGLADEKSGKLPPEVETKIQQMAQLIEQLTGEVNSLTQTIETRKQDLDSRERIAAMNNATRLTETEAKLGHDAAIVELREMLSMMRSDMDRLKQEREQEANENMEPPQQAQQPQPEQPAAPPPA